MRIPKNPVPRPWAKPIAPYQEEGEKEGKHLVVKSILEEKWGSEMLNEQQYMAVLMDPPWKSTHPNDDRAVEVKDLEKMDLPRTASFLFIWTEKQDIPKLVKMLEGKGYNYVENLAWVKQRVNNTFAEQSSDFFKRSKITLLFFRKNTNEQIELRHQRNPDVYFDFVRSMVVEGTTLDREEKPELIFHTIETLLPTANYNEEKGHGRLLYLWSPTCHRKSWTTVSEI